MTDSNSPFTHDQQTLILALTRIKERIKAASLGETRPETTVANIIPPVLEQLCDTFGLSTFEQDLLLLCAGMELDADFPLLCAEANGDPQKPYPTFSLALNIFDDPHWSALTPNAPLRSLAFTRGRRRCGF
ncbi:hypothetical protein [Arthrospira platensis]|uniref:hypothetical protein n=1 Tax=Limnospira platensis TaxID=118562 RepID=UPI000B1CEF33